jgi:hypothetical protein
MPSPTSAKSETPKNPTSVRQDDNFPVPVTDQLIDTHVNDPTEPLATGQIDAQFDSRSERVNMLSLAGYNSSMRVSWIFKTETVIMPAFLDAIAGPGWIRGFLPILNRFGQSIPPLLYADHLKEMPQKSRSLIASTMAMAMIFLGLAFSWYLVVDSPPRWFPFAFLVLYGLFFIATGVNQLTFNTVQGKLIRATSRGKLLRESGIVGSLVSVALAWWLLPGWIAMPGATGYVYIFAASGIGFVLAGLILMLVREPKDELAPGELPHTSPFSIRKKFRNVWQAFTGDKHLRAACYVGMLWMMSLLLFPHYQWIGREQIGCSDYQLMIWVIAQNAGVGFFSSMGGRVADIHGNRRILYLFSFASAITPLWSIGMTMLPLDFARTWYWTTYFILGLNPVIMKLFMNYVLELTPRANHTRYLSAMSVAMGVSFLFSPLVGLAIDLWFEAVFLLISLSAILAGYLAMRLIEPRDHPHLQK